MAVARPRVLSLFVLLILASSVGAVDPVPGASVQQRKLVEQYLKAPTNRIYRNNIKLSLETAKALSEDGRSQTATNLLLSLLSARFNKEHRTNLELAKKKKLRSAHIGPALRAIYIQLYSATARSFLTLNAMTDDFITYEKWLERFYIFAETSSRTDDELERLEILRDQTLLHAKNIRELQYKTSWFILTKMASWQWNGEHTKPSGGRGQYHLTQVGGCLGGGLSISNSKYIWESDACLAYLRTDMQTKGQGQDQLQANINSVGFIASLAFLKYVTASKSASLGIKTNALFFDQNLTAKSSTCGSACQFTPPPRFMAVPAIVMKWHKARTEFFSEFGKNLTQDSSFWALGTIHRF